ncbi:hypothetical protein D3C80_1425180 [compost metagenome]
MHALSLRVANPALGLRGRCQLAVGIDLAFPDSGVEMTDPGAEQLAWTGVEYDHGWGVDADVAQGLLAEVGDDVQAVLDQSGHRRSCRDEGAGGELQVAEHAATFGANLAVVPLQVRPEQCIAGLA